MTFPLPFLWHFCLLRWQDTIEVLVLSGALYAFSKLLAHDTTKPLLFYFYGYCSVLVASALLGLSTITTLLTLLAPLVCAAFVLLHHKTLQKNLITLAALRPSQQPSHDWIQLIIRGSLAAAAEQQSLIFVIEKQDSLQTLVTAPDILESPLSLPLFTLLSKAQKTNREGMIWITADTKIHAYNAHWIKNSIDRWLTEEVASQDSWIQDALFFSHKADCLILKIDALTRTFTFIAQGKIAQHVSSQNAATLIKQYFYSSHFLAGDAYVKTGHTHPHKQTRS